MAGHFVVGWLLAKQKQQNGEASIDVVDCGEENDCRARGNCCYQIGMTVGVERDRADDTFLREDLVDDDEFELILLTLLPLGPIFLRLLSVLS